ncbi:hypothetical protein BHE74_00008944 [Ensete ventricosum]|nr:hypothetical protein GW17_00022751 [Ensete ventricosum]RWW82588.1 hypothetical protein BHE74_00008944 [Ensete ventricosum]
MLLEVTEHVHLWQRADASTDWKEFTTADGRKCVILAREHAEKAAIQIAPKETGTAATSVASTVLSVEMPSSTNALSPAVQPMFSNQMQMPALSGIQSTVTVLKPTSIAVGISAGTNSSSSSGTEPNVGVPNLHPSVTPVSASASSSTGFPSVAADATTTVIRFEHVAFENMFFLFNRGSCQCKTMRVIINDKRYGALKTLGERKQAFNEVSS